MVWTGHFAAAVMFDCNVIRPGAEATFPHPILSHYQVLPSRAYTFAQLHGMAV
jgi:hypothetical protein